MVDKTGLRKALVTYFSQEEINTLCVDLSIDPENFNQIYKEVLARDLIDHLERNHRIEDLIRVCSVERPKIDWRQYLSPAAPAEDRQPPGVPHPEAGPEPEKTSPPVTINQAKDPRPMRFSPWLILLSSPVAWFGGVLLSMTLTGTEASPFVIIGTLGGIAAVILMTWLGLAITGAVSRVTYSQLGRIGIYFLLSGMVSGLVGLMLWFLGCNFQNVPFLSAALGCNQPNQLAWKVLVGISEVVALGAAVGLTFLEFGAARLIRRKAAG